MRKAWLASVIAGLVAVWSLPASASTVLYDSGTTDYNHGSFIDSSSFPQTLYSQFTLTSEATITEMEWEGNRGTPATDIFTYEILSNPGSYGEPGTGSTPVTPIVGSLGSITSTPEIIYPGSYSYDAAVNITLPAGTYYLNIDDTNNGNFEWWGSATPSTEPLWTYNGSVFTSYPSDDGRLAFELTGNVIPEPATMTLLGLGLAGLIGRRMRRSSGR